MSFTAIDISNGQVVIFDETVPYEDRVQAVISSTSIPFAFTPQRMDGSDLIDGGLFSGISLGDPIERCREEGVADEDIIVDVITCYNKLYMVNEWDMDDTRWKNARDYHKRRKVISSTVMKKEAVKRMSRGYPDVDFRLVVQPSKELTSTGKIPIFASAEEIQNEIDTGYADGLQALLDLQERRFDSYDFGDFNLN